MKRRPYTEPEKQFDAAVGRRLESARKQRGVKQAELARAVGIGVSTLETYEAGRRCSLFVLTRIAAVLGVGVSVFVPIATYRENSENIRAHEAKRC